MHAQISGTIDFREKDDPACIARLRRVFGAVRTAPVKARAPFAAVEPKRPAVDVTTVFRAEPGAQYDMVELLSCVVDADSFDEYRAEYGRIRRSSPSARCLVARRGRRVRPTCPR
jgi:acetyl-CoA carboxylase carboxyltransferase component